jgi:hypothetical protein
MAIVTVNPGFRVNEGGLDSGKTRSGSGNVRSGKRRTVCFRDLAKLNLPMVV